MPNTSADPRLVLAALIILGAAFLLCLSGIIYLAAAMPARAIPDVLVVTAGLIGGGIVGMLPGALNGRRVDA